MAISSSSINRVQSQNRLPYHLIEEVFKYLTPSEVKHLASSSPEIACLVFTFSKSFTDVFLSQQPQEFLPLNLRDIKGILTCDVQRFFEPKPLLPSENFYGLIYRVDLVRKKIERGSIVSDLQTEEGLLYLKQLIESATKEGAFSIVQKILTLEFSSIDLKTAVIAAVNHSNFEIASKLLERMDLESSDLSTIHIFLLNFSEHGFFVGVEGIFRLKLAETISRTVINLSLDRALKNQHHEIAQVLLFTPQLNEL